MAMRYEWDQKKAAANFAKHRVSFAMARDTFRDLLAVVKIDDRED